MTQHGAVDALFALGLAAGLAAAVIVDRRTRSIDRAMLTYLAIVFATAISLIS